MILLLALLAPPALRSPLTGGEGGQADPRADEIRSLIRLLAEIDRPDVGLSPTMSGTGFAPVPASGRFGAGLLGVDHQLRAAIPLTSLVHAGPDALPQLLESLEDPTPTKLRIAKDPPIGAMWYGRELQGNPENAVEWTALQGGKGGGGSGPRGHPIAEHVVTIGDVCFVAIGQITNRSYQAVRYQPTACVVVNSPVKDAKLAAEVRAIWGKGDQRRKLLESLKADFASRGDESHVFQRGAALRLVYYFPSEGVPLVVERLRGLDVVTDDARVRYAKDRISADTLIESVSWSADPRIQAELLGILRKTKDPSIVAAAVPGIPAEHDALVLDGLKERIAALPPKDKRVFGDGFHLLGLVIARFPREAKEVFRAYLRDAGVQRLRTACHAFARAEGDLGGLAIDVLAPILTDRRPADGWTYPVEPGKSEPRLPIRLCDEAAQALSLRNPDLLHFELFGTHDRLDRQIEGMRRAILERPRK
jgi:hypothetical protein